MDTCKPQLHPCAQIYVAGANGITYGDTQGHCRITGQAGTGIPFGKWVRKTFTDYPNLHPGEIISNEALFCFEEASELIMRKTGKDKPQRFRTYSHIIHNGEWFCYTKADKQAIYEHITGGAELICLADSGQKHILFKHRPGMWQLEENFILPDVTGLEELHRRMCRMLHTGFSQTEIISGNYISGRILKIGVDAWKEDENAIQSQRGSSLFNFASWMLF